MPRTPPRYDVFICHARGDVPLAGALRAALERLGRSAFSAEDDLRPGDRWHLVIPDAQDASRVIAILISDHWGEGHYNHGELSTAIARYREDDGRRIVPVLFDAVGRGALPYGLETFAPLVGDRRAVDAVARSLLAIIDDAGRVELAADLSMATAVLEDLEADGIDGDALAEARDRVVQLKRALRAGGQLSTGDRLGGRYKLEEAVGDGGFATVWRAWDTVKKRRVAIKVLHAQHARDRTRRERFVRGARQMAAFDHPHIVPVYEPQAYDDGFRYFVMAWMPGGDLRAVVLDGGLDRARGRQVLLDVAEGLAAAHSRGLIHRDVKPGNILIDVDGRARLSDFDLVRAPDTTGGTRTGGLGTTLFAAPEAFTQAKDADERADVYGLGMTAAFILRGGPLPGWVLRKPEKLIDELDCSPALKAALHKAVEFEPGDRWESVAAFVEALDATWAEPSLPPGPPRLIETGPIELPHLGERPTLPGPSLPTTGGPPLYGPNAPRRVPSALTLTAIAAFGLLSGGVGWYLAHQAGLTGVDAGVLDGGPPPDAAPDAAPLDASPPVDATPDGDVHPAPGALIEPGTRYRPTLLYIPGGAFEQGSPEGERHRQPDETRHRVELRPFVMASTPVTSAQYNRVFDRRGGDRHPMVDVTWEMAVSYCNRLSTKEGRATAYVKRSGRWSRRPKATGYRLPTEAEWERACRAEGAPAEFDAVAWYVGNSREQTHMVRLKAPNAWGLHDMLGNVWEWAEDIYGAYPAAAVVDPRGPDAGRKRVIRGASYRDPARSLRCADRFAEFPDQAQPWIGFRVVRDIDPPREP